MDDNLFGPIIDVHTRADALAAGDLVAVPAAAASDAGIWWDTALTRAAWTAIGNLPEALAEIRAAVMRRGANFTVGGAAFVLAFEAGDDAVPRCTVSLPDES